MPPNSGSAPKWPADAGSSRKPNHRNTRPRFQPASPRRNSDIFSPPSFTSELSTIIARRVLDQRKFHAMPERIDSLRPYPHAISQPKGSSLSSAPARTAIRLADNRMVAVVIRTPLRGKFLQPVNAHQSFHENFHQLHKKSELLHGNNQRLIFLAQMALHELRRLPFHHSAPPPPPPPLRFRAFCGDILQFHAPVWPQHRHGFLFPLARVFQVSAQRRHVRIFQRPFQRPVHDQIRIAPDRRREMRVFLRRQRKMSQHVHRIARLLQRTQHQIRKNPLFRLPRDSFRQPLVMLRPYVHFFHRGHSPAHRPHAPPPPAAPAPLARLGARTSVPPHPPPLRQIFHPQRISKR